MKVTAVFLSKKNSNRKNQVINNIRKSKEKATFKLEEIGNTKDKSKFKISKLPYFPFVIFGILVFFNFTPLLSKVIYFGSNFRQAEEKSIEFAQMK